MEFAAFEEMLREMCHEIPREYFDGITEVVASPRTRPHPDNLEVFTLGECIPLPIGGEESAAVQSRIVLYHGSFRALAETDESFDWTDEAWETLTHELRHHLEWRAQRDDLGDLDDVMEENFRRRAGEAVDPGFYLEGVPHGHGWFEVGGDWFLDLVVDAVPTSIAFTWHGELYDVAVPAGILPPAYLQVESGLQEPPEGDLLIALRRRPRLRDLLARPTLPAHHGVAAELRLPEVPHGV